MNKDKNIETITLDKDFNEFIEKTLNEAWEETHPNEKQDTKEEY